MTHTLSYWLLWTYCINNIKVQLRAGYDKPSKAMNNKIYSSTKILQKQCNKLDISHLYDFHLRQYFRVSINIVLFDILNFAFFFLNNSILLENKTLYGVALKLLFWWIVQHRFSTILTVQEDSGMSLNWFSITIQLQHLCFLFIRP